MPSFTDNDQLHQNLQFSNESSSQIKITSRQAVIKTGVSALHEAGTDYICKVCIANGGSCCSSCRYLVNGIGCQQLNTSCTAWLCGFLKYLLYETGFLQEWNDFWDQVPGQNYRKDFTPEYFFIGKSLSIQNIRNLSEALAADLQELAKSHIAVGFILTLREKIDKNIDRLNGCKHDPERQIKLKRTIKILSSPFHRFQKKLSEYLKYSNTERS